MELKKVQLRNCRTSKEMMVYAWLTLLFVCGRTTGRGG